MRTWKSWSGRVVAAGWWSLRAILAWIGSHDLIFLGSGLIVLLAIFGFAALADEVSEGATQRFDDWAVRAMRRPDDLAQPIGPRWLAEAGRDITALGSFTVLTLLVAAVIGFLWLIRSYGPLWLVFAATTSGLVANLLLKDLFDRPRPSVVPHLAHVSSSSFPSGHSMLSATIYLTLGAVLAQSVQSRVLKAYFLLVAAALTGLVGVSRVFLGVHYPTDVLGGWIAGSAWALGSAWIARALRPRFSAPEIVSSPAAPAASNTSLDR